MTARRTLPNCARRIRCTSSPRPAAKLCHSEDLLRAHDKLILVAGGPPARVLPELRGIMGGPYAGYRHYMLFRLGPALNDANSRSVAEPPYGPALPLSPKPNLLTQPGLPLHQEHEALNSHQCAAKIEASSSPYSPPVAEKA